MTDYYVQAGFSWCRSPLKPWFSAAMSAAPAFITASVLLDRRSVDDPGLARCLCGGDLTDVSADQDARGLRLIVAHPCIDVTSTRSHCSRFAVALTRPVLT